MRSPIGIRIYRSTHARIRAIAHDLGVPNGEVVDRAIKMFPPVQAELPLGRPTPATFVRCHRRRLQKNEVVQ